MPYLILIRHSQTKQRRDIHSHLWELTEEGRKRCVVLAEQLRRYSITRIVTSTETKAQQTGQLVAELLGIPCHAVPELHETRRETAPYYECVDDFKAAIWAAMQEPDKLLFGEETFTEARQRFARQIDRLLQHDPDETLAIVTHGTVMALYLAHLSQQNVYTLWETLDMPAYAVLSLSEKTVTELVMSMIQETTMTTIRAAREQDIAGIRTLADAAIRQTMAATGIEDSAYVDRLLARVYSEDKLRRSIANKKTTLLVADENGAIVGLCQFGSPLLDECEDRKEIHRLLVHPAYCRKGIGGLFIEAIEQSLRGDVVVRRVSVYINPSDIGRLRFFAKHGFYHDQIEDKDGEWYMEKGL